ncbi:perforin-1-like [Puntigrus tetrazona]|uniref:perforin-1-like n=1 Tax=Puntigrus tetrazona TaxID=1606681 RepID=UPI001C89B6BF|nr:perforin-1-like [Puntigrus tetrazona]
MAVSGHLGLASLVVLMLASQLDFSSAAVLVYDLHANNLSGDAAGNKPDPYLKIWCGGSFEDTNYIKDNSNPQWTESFTFSSCDSGDKLKMEVWDKDTTSDDHLGWYSGPVGIGNNNHISFSVGQGTMYLSYDVK